MSLQSELVIDWCSYQAAKYAVMRWHYSKTMPASTVNIGVWENDNFIGAILFSRGANRLIGSPYGLTNEQVCELVRVALGNHVAPVTQMIKIAISMLKKQSPGLRLIVSYADGKEGHFGGIYQAGNWIYVGASVDCFQKINGKLFHRRSVGAKYGRQDLEWLRDNIDPQACYVEMPGKHKYLYPLDKAMRKQIESLAQPYPKKGSYASEATK